MRSDVDDGRIRELRQTASIRGIAAQLACSPSTVQYRLRRLGASRRPRTGERPLGLPAATVQAVGAAYRRGASLASLRKRFGLSEGKIRRALEQDGTPVRLRGRPARDAAAPPTISAVRPLHTQGMRPSDIASQLGCAKSDVLGVLGEAGLKPNRGRPMPPAAELAAGWDQTPSVRSLAQRWHISESRLRPVLDQLGIRAAEHAAPAAAAVEAGRAPSQFGRPTGKAA
jgi:hypothetical protein